MPKTLNATIDEVNETAQKLERQIAATKEQVELKFKLLLEALETKLRAEVQQVQVNVDRVDGIKIEQPSCDKVAAAAEKRLLEVAVAIRKEIEVVAPPILERIQRTGETLQQQIVETDAEARNAFAQELESLCVNFDKELTAVKENLQAQIEERAVAADVALRRERKALDAELVAARSEAAVATQEVKGIAAEELQKVIFAQEDVDKKQDVKAKSVQASNELKFIEVESVIQKRAEEAAAALAQSIANAESALAEEHVEMERNFQQRDGQLEGLKNSISDVQNVPTRKVEWVIKSATLLTKKAPGAEDENTYVSWSSPKFDAAGAQAMQLELRLHRPPMPEELQTLGGGKGNVSVLLHAPHDTHIAFKISIAKASEIFEHRFEGGRPFGAQRFCTLEEQIDIEKNTLTVGIEVLECIAELRKRCTQPEDDIDEQGHLKPWLEADFRIQRHTNNRVLDMVKTQLDWQKKRMTRRIEWRLEQASMMKRNFARGAPMRSKVFDAAGIEGMQLHFYPAGYDTALEGFASLFLSAPEGTTLRCTLQVADERKEVSHTFERAGLCGKANFLRFDACINEQDDFIQIAMDITEAHVCLVAKASHSPPTALGLRSFSKEAHQLVPLGSTMKLARYAEHLPEILREVMVLPSLWAGRNRFDAEAKPADILKPLKDTRKGRPKSGGMPRSPSSPLLK